MKETIKMDRIEDAIADFKEGKFVIVVDDEDRENEGDLIIAAEKITPEKVNFMLKHARGVLCAPVTVSRCKELDLPHQVSDNTSVLGTPFTVTIDKLEGCTTGVSASDRAATIQALADPTSTPATFGRPGHINPLYAQEKGVLRRAGHTEATIDMARLAGLYPAGALMEIMSEDGTMARLPELRQMADEHGLKLISIHDLIVYRLKQESIVEKGVEVNMPTEHGKFRLIPFRQKSNGLEHMAIFKGTWSEDEPILVRVHSSCATGDILGSQRCDCGEQLHKAMEMIEKEGKGVVARAREAFRAQAFAGALGGMTPAKNQGAGKPLTGSQALVSLQKGRQLAAGGNGPLGYEVGDRVRHVKFGEGTVTDIKEGGRDHEVTIEFDSVGTRKMFAKFAKLVKV